MVALRRHSSTITTLAVVACVAIIVRVTTKIAGLRAAKRGGRGRRHNFFLFNWGAGRHPIGLIKPVGVEVAHSRVKRRQSDLFREIFLISVIFDL